MKNTPLNDQNSLFSHIRQDIPASIVVFFVAMPLCLGIALASGAPLFSGIIAGIVGGIVVGALSNSSLGVSGPAAGLAVIVLTSIQSLGTATIKLASPKLSFCFIFILSRKFFSDSFKRSKPDIPISKVPSPSLCIISFACKYIIFAFGYFGFPEMGSVGCGYATSLVSFIMLITLGLIVIFSNKYKKTELTKKFSFISVGKFE